MVRLKKIQGFFFRKLKNIKKFGLAKGSGLNMKNMELNGEHSPERISSYKKRRFLINFWASSAIYGPQLCEREFSDNILGQNSINIIQECSLSDKHILEKTKSGILSWWKNRPKVFNQNLITLKKERVLESRSLNLSFNRETPISPDPLEIFKQKQKFNRLIWISKQKNKSLEVRLDPNSRLYMRASSDGSKYFRWLAGLYYDRWIKLIQWLKRHSKFKYFGWLLLLSFLAIFRIRIFNILLRFFRKIQSGYFNLKQGPLLRNNKKALIKLERLRHRIRDSVFGGYLTVLIVASILFSIGLTPDEIPDWMTQFDNF